MRRTVTVLCLLTLLLSCTAGCSAFLEREYYVKTPHSVQKTEDLPAGEVLVDSKNAIKDVIRRMIANGIEQRDLRATDYSGDFGGDIDIALYEVQEEEPLAVYAVSYSSYDKSRILTQQTATISIKYRRDVSAVLSVSGGTAFREILAEAQRAYIQKMVLDISFYDAELYDVSSTFDTIYYTEPVFSMEKPEITTVFYPELSHAGTRRIVEIEFLYTQPQEKLRQMYADTRAKTQKLLSERPAQESTPETALWLHDLLCDQTEYDKDAAEEEAESGLLSRMENHTAYGALWEGKAVSEGYALAFQMLCKELGLDARIVKGRKNRVEYYWNLIELEGDWYHIDVAGDDTGKNPNHTGFLKSDDEMRQSEQYVWDTGKLPSAKGPLDYESVLARFPEPSPQEPDGDPEG